MVKEKYKLQAVQAVEKLTRAYIDAATSQQTVKTVKTVKIETQFDDNLITRVIVSDLLNLMHENGLNNNSGYFYEYICKGSAESTGSKGSNDFLTALRYLFNDKRCQTVSYIGKPEMFDALLESGISGIDRIVPVGRTMDFDLIWDGYNLSKTLSRTVAIV